MATITQDMRYRLSLIKYADKYGVTKAAVKYKTNRQYIYRWKRRYDGSIDSLRDLSRKPHHHPNQHPPCLWNTLLKPFPVPLSASGLIMGMNLPTALLQTKTNLPSFRTVRNSTGYVISLSDLTLRDITAKWNAATGRTMNAFMPPIHSIPLMTLQSS